MASGNAVGDMPEDGLVDDASIRHILERSDEWRTHAKALADAALISLRNRMDQNSAAKEGSVEGDLQDEAIITLYERWCRQIADGSFLHAFDPKKSNSASTLYKQAIHYLTGNVFELTVNTHRLTRQRTPGMGEQVDVLEDWSDVADRAKVMSGGGARHGVGIYDLWDEVADPVEKAVLRDLLSKETPRPRLNAPPTRVNQTWRTAVHMSWPQLSAGGEAGEDVVRTALSELDDVAGQSAVSSDAWLKKHAADARTELEAERKQLGMAYREAELARDQAWSLRPKAGSSEICDADGRWARCLKQCQVIDRRLLALIVETLVMQFRPDRYAAVFGREQAGTAEYKRRSRLLDAMPRIFVFGERFQKTLRLAPESSTDET